MCIFAFRAEALDNYGCYKKAKIDLVSESTLCLLLADGNIGELIALLNEKRLMGDTVIDMAWLQKLRFVELCKNLGFAEVRILKLTPSGNAMHNWDQIGLPLDIQNDLIL